MCTNHFKYPSLEYLLKGPGHLRLIFATFLKKSSRSSCSWSIYSTTELLIIIWNHSESEKQICEANHPLPGSWNLHYNLSAVYSVRRNPPPPGWSLPYEAWRNKPIGELLQCTRRLQGILVGRLVTLLWRGELVETGRNAIYSKLQGQIGDHQSPISNL